MSKGKVEFEVVNEKILVDYVRASLKAKEAKEKVDGMKDEIMDRLSEEDVDDDKTGETKHGMIGVMVDGDIYTVRLQERDNFQYSQTVYDLEAKLKELKKVEEATKVATKKAPTIFPVVNKK